MRRSKTGQTAHDAKVIATANRYRRDGWRVSADVDGFKQPKTVYNKRPDIIARRGNQERIIEVENTRSMQTDRSQRAAFQRYANNNPNKSFRTLVARKRSR